MSQQKNKAFSFFELQKGSTPTKKILTTFLLLFFFKLGTAIPLSNVDNEALRKSFLQFGATNNSLFQILTMYSGSGGKTVLSPFSLGIIPFINASIVIDLLTALSSDLEKLQSDEIGRRQLTYYKKIVTLFLAAIQSYFLISALKPYFYRTDFFHCFLTGFEFVTGSLIMVWLTSILDKQGLGNGTSLLIFTNILTNLFQKNQTLGFASSTKATLFDLFFLSCFTALICLSQMGKISIPIVSARQLLFLETNSKNKTSNEVEIKNSTLLIRFTQAGIFPIIIASNLFPIFSSLFGNNEFITRFFYYVFNYFYTSVFWDPEKISEQLRKASVAIVNVTPGRATVTYLENVVRFSSVLGGVFLCFILYFYDTLKQVMASPFLNQIAISSLIILVGVIFELQKTLRSMFLTRLIKE